jgi:hypothetical protein
MKATSITVNQFFFETGRADANNAKAFASSGFAELLRPLNGKIEQKAADTWNAYRKEYIKGYESVLTDGSASRRWTRLVEGLGFTKPQTPAAAAKQAQRAKHAPSKPVVVKAEKVAELVSSGESVATTARETACEELLHALSPENLIKAQKYLLQLVERQAA